MKDYEQQKIMSSGSRGRRSQYNLEKLPPAAHISYKPEMVGTRLGWVTIISPQKRWSQKWNHCYVLTQYNLEKLPPAAHISYKPEMVGTRLGWVTIISPQKRWSQKWNHCYVLTKCNGCESIQWQDLNQLQRGKSKGCQACSQKRKIPIWLEKRLTAAKSRCENERDPEYRNYGARGIKFRFASVIEAGQYLMSLYPQLSRHLEIDRIDTNGNYEPGNIRFASHEQNQANKRNTVLSEFKQEYPQLSRHLEIDRIDTNGNYEPGNIRFASHEQNQANKRNTVLSEFKQEYWPYSRNVVVRRLSQGYTREQIIKQAEDSVKRK